MISIEMARQLREAGLEWHPAERDVFALPGRDMDDQLFVVSPLPALLQRYNGLPVVTFQASAEWALDYVTLSEALWMPSEGQLREALLGLLAPGAPLSLTRIPLGYRCAVGIGGQPRSFEGSDAETAYACAPTPHGRSLSPMRCATIGARISFVGRSPTMFCLFLPRPPC